MVLANIVQKNITTLILILPNGLCLVILYTMKHEIQSMYRTVLIVMILTTLRNSLSDYIVGIYCKISALFSYSFLVAVYL